jgi:pimeloyl-ACP methyl ester carboxylesterase
MLPGDETDQNIMERSKTTIPYYTEINDFLETIPWPARATKRIECPLFVLWSTYLDVTYGGSDNIISIWSRWARDVKGECISAGHFFAEEKPMETAMLLRDFLK